MSKNTCTHVVADAANVYFEQEMYKFLCEWIYNYPEAALLRFDQSLEEYLAKDALRDFFLNTEHPLLKLLENKVIACHLGRDIEDVFFDTVSGDPLLSHTEQRIYNLARRMDSEQMHVPFRSVQPNKQTENGDNEDISTYPTDSEEIRYNSGNHFASRPANGNVFDEHSKQCLVKSKGNLHVLFKRGYLNERLQDIIAITAEIKETGESQLQFFVIYSRHSITEGHFGVSLVVMDPANPIYPKRVLVCDTLLKELPQHPRWWHHFVNTYSFAFGNAVAEIIEDLSHPLQKVNIRGDDPYRHDWDCPYYAASMAEALTDLVKKDLDLLVNGSVNEIYNAMKELMPDYYETDLEIKDRASIQQVNRVKRWESGRLMIKHLAIESNKRSSYEF
jgi:hypothetical protein